MPSTPSESVAEDDRADAAQQEHGGADQLGGEDATEVEHHAAGVGDPPRPALRPRALVMRAARLTIGSSVPSPSSWAAWAPCRRTVGPCRNDTSTPVNASSAVASASRLRRYPSAVARKRTERLLVTRVTPRRRARRRPDELIVEEPMTIQLDGVTVATTMRTPGNDYELAVGFCVTDGLLAGAPVTGVRYCADGSAATTRSSTS